MGYTGYREGVGYSGEVGRPKLESQVEVKSGAVFESGGMDIVAVGPAVVSVGGVGSVDLVIGGVGTVLLVVERDEKGVLVYPVLVWAWDQGGGFSGSQKRLALGQGKWGSCLKSRPISRFFSSSSVSILAIPAG